MKKILHLLGASSAARLGPLEQQLLQAIWSRGNGTVRELLIETESGPGGGRKVAYTTVMTTLDRLYKKRLLDRVAEGRAFRYWPRQTEQELRKAAAGEAIQQLLDSGAAAASFSSSSLPLSYLVEAITERDVQLLDELQRLVERKRNELQRRESGNGNPASGAAAKKEKP